LVGEEKREEERVEGVGEEGWSGLLKSAEEEEDEGTRSDEVEDSRVEEDCLPFFPDNRLSILWR
jgi:hypothetical protein